MHGKEFFWAGTIFKQDMNPEFLHSWKMEMPAIPAIQIHSLASGELITILTAYYNSVTDQWESRQMRRLRISLVNFQQNRRLEWEFDDFSFKNDWEKIKAEQYSLSNAEYMSLAGCKNFKGIP